MSQTIYNHSGTINTLVRWTWAVLMWVGLAIGGGASVHAAPTFELTSATLGTLKKWSVFAQLDVADADQGMTGQVFVVAVLPNSTLFALTPVGWTAASQTHIPAYLEGRLGTHTLDILTGVDVSALGGTEVYVGYGTSFTEMLKRQQFGMAYTIPSDVPFTSFQADWREKSAMYSYVFRDFSALQTYWGTLVNVPTQADGTPIWAYPEVDWSTQMVIGTIRPTTYSSCQGGTSNLITKIFNNGKRIEVYTLVQMPVSPSSVTCTGEVVVSKQVQFVTLPRSDLPVVFIPTTNP
jgi:hypothetical protein